MTITRPGALDLEIFRGDPAAWMSLGERVAVEGVLAELKPALSIATGATRGGALPRIMAHSEKVHVFGLADPSIAVRNEDSVTVHAGDPRVLLPAELKRIADEGLNVDFVFVDGGRSPLGARQDVEDLLNSRAVAHTVILIHDVNSDAVRAGLEAIYFAAWPKVDDVDLDFVPGYMFRDEPVRYELWGGLGLVVVDSNRLAYTAGSVIKSPCYPAASLFAEARDQVVARGAASKTSEGDEQDEADVDEQGAASQVDRLLAHIGELEGEILRVTSVSVHHEELWREMMASVSWSVTWPLRWLAGFARRLASK
jgi:hypothetical protein